VLEFPYQIQSFKSMDMQVCVGAKVETKWGNTMIYMKIMYGFVCIDIYMIY
jgi:hypothetical protein